MVSARVFFFRVDLKNFLTDPTVLLENRLPYTRLRIRLKAKSKNNFNLGTPTPLKFRTKFPSKQVEMFNCDFLLKRMR